MHNKFSTFRGKTLKTMSSAVSVTPLLNPWLKLSGILHSKRTRTSILAANSGSIDLAFAMVSQEAESASDDVLGANALKAYFPLDIEP